MPGIVTLLSTFRGRISCAQWWAGFVIVLAGSLAGTVLFNPDAFSLDTVPEPYWPDTFWQLAWLVPGTAITVKRFNDRNWPWWLGYAVGGIAALAYLLPHFGLLIDPDLGGFWGALLFWVSLLTLIGAFIDNGFLRGTPGPNRYGPDPLAFADQPA